MLYMVTFTINISPMLAYIPYMDPTPNVSIYGYGSIPIDTFLVGWTSIYQLFWGSLGTRVLTHHHIPYTDPMGHTILYNIRTTIVGITHHRFFNPLNCCWGPELHALLRLLSLAPLPAALPGTVLLGLRNGHRFSVGFYQWPFQEPKLEVPTIYKACVRPM